MAAKAVASRRRPGTYVLIRPLRRATNSHQPQALPDQWLRGFLSLPNGIPSHDTFGRVFAAMNNKLFAESFRAWTEGLRKKISGEIVAIDGKTLRRSHHKSSVRSGSTW